MSGSYLPRGRRRRSKNYRKGLGAFLNRLVGAFVPMLGVLSQELDRIGANGFMVLRMRVQSKHDAGSCRGQRQGGDKRDESTCDMHFRYKTRLGGPGEPLGATRGPRGRPWRPPECPDGLDGADVGVPGGERG